MFEADDALNWEEMQQVLPRLQRDYLTCWYGCLRSIRPELTDDEAKARCRAVVGMVNASRHVVGRSLEEPTRAALPDMVRGALGVPQGQ